MNIAEIMISLTLIFVLGLIFQQGQCQMSSLAALAGMGGLAGMGRGGAGGLGGMGMLGLGMSGLEPNELMNLMMLTGNTGGSAGGSGSAAGSGGSPGGIDPTMLFMMSQGGMGGMGNMNEMLPMLMLMGNQNQGQQQQQPPVQLNPMAREVLKFLGDSGTGITPNNQNSLWHLVSMHRKQGKLFESANPETQRQLERDGLIAGLDPFISMTSCPIMTPDKCPLALCETREVPHTPESFYICKGCPRCPLDASQRKLLNMMKMMNPGATKRDVNEMASQLSMMKALRASPAGKNPMMMAQLMKSMKSREQKRLQRQDNKATKKALKAMAKKQKKAGSKVPADIKATLGGKKPSTMPSKATLMPGQAPMIPANMQMVPPPGWMVPGQMIQLQPGPQGVPSMVLAGPPMIGASPQSEIKIVAPPVKMPTDKPKPEVSPSKLTLGESQASYPGEPAEPAEPNPTAEGGSPSTNPIQSAPKLTLGPAFPQPPAEFVAAMKRMRAKMEAQRLAMKPGNKNNAYPKA